MDNQTRILIIEDHEGFRKIYQTFLEGEGFEVLVAEDGQIGLQLAKEKIPHLVVLDLGLPKIDGFEVLRVLRDDPTTRSIPILILSILSDVGNMKRATEMGANDYAVKGFYTPRQILGKIKNLLVQVDLKKEV